jgi:hypothetical protein
VTVNTKRTIGNYRAGYRGDRWIAIRARWIADMVRTKSGAPVAGAVIPVE